MAEQTAEKVRQTRKLGRIEVVVIGETGHWESYKVLTQEPESIADARRLLREANAKPGRYRIIRVCDEFEVTHKAETKVVFS